MRVLFVGPVPPPVHGVAHIMKTLIESDLREQFDLRVLDIADRSARGMRTMGRLTVSNILGALWACWRMFWRTLWLRPRVVYIFLSQSRWALLRDSILIRIATLLGARVVAPLHGGHFRDLYESWPPRRRRRIRRVLNKIALIQVLSDKMRFIFSGLVPDERIEVAPNGIEAELYESAASERDKRKPGRNLLFLSNLHATKGYLDAVKAFILCADEYPDSKLDIAGTWLGDEREEVVLKLIEESGLGGRIALLGSVRGQAKLDLFARSDVFVLPTSFRYEGQPVAILEAMAGGLPVISCDHGAITDMVIDGKGGFIVPSNNPEQIAARLRILFEDPDLARAQGEFNVTRIKEKFSLEGFIDKIGRDIRKVGSGLES